MSLSLGLGLALTRNKGVGVYPRYTDFGFRPGGQNLIDGVRAPFSAFTFTRASTAELMSGGSRAAFASGEPRISGGSITLDGGATNALASPEDPSNAAWTKSAATVGAQQTLGGGTVPYWPLLETATTAAHYDRQSVSSSATDWLFMRRIAPTLGRTRARFDVGGTQTGSGGRILFDLTGNGAVTSALTTGSPAGSVLGSGCSLEADGVYLCWAIIRTGNTSHTSVYAQTSIDDGSSYAGDTAKGLLVGPAMLANVSEFRSYTASTRAAETLTVPLASGFYDFRVRNSAAEEWRGAVDVSGGVYTITPPAGYATITKIEGYKLDFVKDWSGDADTSDGDVPGFDLRGPYAGSYPLPAATKGKISGGKVVAGQGDVVYVTKVFDEPLHYMAAIVSWTDTGGAGAEATAAMFATSDPNVISNMPHHTLDRDTFKVGKRIGGGSIVVDATYNFTPNPAENGTQFPVRHSTSKGGTVTLAVRNSERMDYTDADLADGGVVEVGLRGVWEIYQPSATAGNTLAIHKVAARYRPILLAA